MFTDRTTAGRELAQALHHFAAQPPLVLGLPRGGVVVAAEVARALRGDLDVLLVKKLRAPGNPELALGAIGEEGRIFLNEQVPRCTGADGRYLQREVAARLAEIATQRDLYRAVRQKFSPAGRVVILVDDGLATGATMFAAVQVMAVRQPQTLVVAVPVSPADTLEKLRTLTGVDEVVCLLAPEWFEGVGQFYENFAQVEDAEVVRVLGAFPAI